MMRAALLWTGGKDCTLALCRARDAGLHVECLATFYPEGQSTPFKAHPLDRLLEIAHEAGFKAELLPVREPYRASYVASLMHLREKHGVDAVITGDIDHVDGRPNWIGECAPDAGLEAMLPLWQCAREPLLRELIRRGIEAKLSWINSPHIPQSWLGRFIDDDFIDDIVALANEAPIDICGENGEYHTMVQRIPLAATNVERPKRARNTFRSRW